MHNLILCEQIRKFIASGGIFSFSEETELKTRKLLKLSLLVLWCCLMDYWSVDTPTTIFSCWNRVLYRNKWLCAFEIIAYQF